MAWLELRAPAKLNLFLELKERRVDGFHELETIMTPINLFDNILLRPRADQQICLTQIPGATTSNLAGDRQVFSMPLNSTNLVWKAIELLQLQSGQRFGMDVAIQKNIPAEAGMGGGSSDAATVLLGANQLLNLAQTPRQLTELASQLGSDVAFFITSQTARCLGRGEHVKPIHQKVRTHFVIAMPSAGLSTAEVYRHSQISAERRCSGALESGLANSNVNQVASGLFNRLQQAAEKLCPSLQRIKEAFQKTQCLANQLTGSGAAWFALYSNRQQACRAKNWLAARLPECHVFRASTTGNEAKPFRYLPE